MTPAKLANFPEVGCFVVVACPENTLYDTKEYFCPIVTPYELAVALDYAEWTESYETDFRKVLQGTEFELLVCNNLCIHFTRRGRPHNIFSKFRKQPFRGRV